MKEIRLHGIGGLGTVKAGEMLVHAAVASGKYGNSIPFFGFERQGAPVTSYVRLGDEKIRPKNQVYHPNCTLVLDPSLLISAPVFDGLTENSYFIVNTKAENGADLVKIPTSRPWPGWTPPPSPWRCWAVPSPTPSCWAPSSVPPAGWTRTSWKGHLPLLRREERGDLPPRL